MIEAMYKAGAVAVYRRYGGSVFLCFTDHYKWSSWLRDTARAMTKRGEELIDATGHGWYYCPREGE